ncbi:MAG: hypothetical protein ACTSYB_09335, partial [Candidatus Helarchaeota archaeon]
SLLDTVLAALLLAFYAMFASIFLKRLVQNNLNMDLKAKINVFTVSFITAFLLDHLIRTIGFSSDISLVPIHLNPELWVFLQYLWLFVQIPLSVLLIWSSIRTKSIIFPTEPAQEPEDCRNEPWILNALGLGMFLFLLFNVFLYPSAIAEYTDTQYAIINPILISAITLVLLYLLFGKERMLYNFRINLCFNLVLILALATFLFFNAVLALPTAILMALSVGIMYLDAHLLILNMSITKKPGNQLKSLSKLFSYGFLFLILMTFLHDFTTDHAFTISAFKGMGPHILLIGGFILLVMTLLAHLQLKTFEEGRSG